MKLFLIGILLTVNSFVKTQEPTLIQRVQTLVSDIESLPEICNQNATLYNKALQFQNKLNQIKSEVEIIDQIFINELIPFDHSARKFFNTRIFLFYTYKNFNYNIKFSNNPSTLRQQLRSLSSSFQNTYNFTFNQSELTPIESYSNWAKSLFQTLNCLSSNSF